MKGWPSDIADRWEFRIHHLLLPKSVPFGAWFRATVPFLRGESLRARIVRASFWSIAAGAAAQAGALLSSILCARLLGADAFGQLSVVRSTVLMLSGLAGGGLGVVGSRYVAEYRTSDRERVGRIIGLIVGVAIVTSSLVALMAIGFAESLASWISHPELTALLRLGSLILVTNTLQGAQLGVLAGFERFRAIAVVGGADGLLNAALPTLGAYQWGIEGAILGFAASGAAGSVCKNSMINRVGTDSGIRVRWRGATREFRVLWTVAVPSVVTGIVCQPCEWLSRLILVRRSGSLAALGVFTAAYSLGQLIAFFPGQISGLVTPILSNFLAAGDLQRARKLLGASHVLVLSAAVVVALPLIVLPGPVLAVYGRGFTHGWSALVLMALTYIMCSRTLVCRAVFAATDRVWLHAGQTTVWGGILVMGAYALAPLGVDGLALAYLVAYAVFTAMQLRSERGAIEAARPGPR